MFYSILFAATALTALVSASPTPANLSPRACTTQLPTSYQEIIQVLPTNSYPQNQNFYAYFDANTGYHVDTLVHFTGIPAGSYGCQLVVEFSGTNNPTSSGATQLNVYNLLGAENDITPTSNYQQYFPNGGSGAPNGTALWGTVTLDGQRHVINSAVCTPSMSFLFEIASETTSGVVEWNNLAAGNGFELTYNC